MTKRILNVGCGAETYGTDFIDLYPQRPEVKKCDLDREAFPYEDNIFDEVYSKLVFEHLTNVRKFMEESYRVLKPGGRIVIITDNAGLFGLFGKVHHGNYELEHSATPEDRHYMLFTPNHLRNFLEKFGFAVESVDYLDLSDDLRTKLLTRLSKKLCPNLKAVGLKSDSSSIASKPKA